MVTIGLDGLFAFGIFAEDFYVAHQRPDGVDGLCIACVVVEFQVDVKLIFPFVSDDWQRLYFCQIDVVERQNGQHFRQAAFFVWQGKHDG